MKAVLRADETDLAAALRALSAKLHLSAGITSAASDEKTVAVFGAPMTPLEVVRRILADVREKGDAAVAEYTKKLDGVDLTPDAFAAAPDEVAAAWADTPDDLKRSLETAAANIRRYQTAVKVRDPDPVEGAEGGSALLRYLPLRRVGICVPGWLAAYPSTVLMTAIPAAVAGVREIVLVSPCSAEGKARPETLAAARVAGVTEVYRIGGAQGVGALAYGTETIRRVDKIVGPGNIFVTLAKREVYGEVDIDMLAGPSEILIIADSTADPRFLAADLLSQAEHDPAASVLLTPDANVAEATVREIERQVAELSRAEAAQRCLDRYGFVGVTRDLDQAVELANQFAPEHLEIVTEDPGALAPRLHSAGAIFIGPYTPEPVGDYVAGPSHVLPTGGTARFFSGLSVNDFLRRTSVLRYSRDALKQVVDDIDVIARAEGLDAHAWSATVRFEREPQQAGDA